MVLVVVRVKACVRIRVSMMLGQCNVGISGKIRERVKLRLHVYG